MRSTSWIVRSGQANLRLFCLLLLLLGLSLRDRGEPLLCPDLCTLSALGNDGCKVLANNAALVFYGSTRPFLRHLLRDALLVHATVRNRPCNLARVLALQKQRFTLRCAETKYLKVYVRKHQRRSRIDTNFAITTDEQATLTRVYLVVSERVNFEFLQNNHQWDRDRQIYERTI
jgi:hypothetical protein